MAGMTEASINCPFETVKVRMQQPGSAALYKNTMDAAMAIVRKEGLLALYNGYEAQTYRNGTWNGAYFLCIAKLKRDLLPATDGSRGKEMARNFSAGFLAGLVATTVNTPFDIAKSRLQASTTESNRWFRALPTMATVFREEGAGALFKGYMPRLYRLGPGGGIMLLAFDLVSSFLG